MLGSLEREPITKWHEGVQAQRRRRDRLADLFTRIDIMLYVTSAALAASILALIFR